MAEMDGLLIYEKMPNDEAVIEQPTAMLRWNEGYLEQRWQVLTFHGGRPVSRRHEWRQVPDAEEQSNG